MKYNPLTPDDLTVIQEEVECHPDSLKKALRIASERLNRTFNSVESAYYRRIKPKKADTKVQLLTFSVPNKPRSFRERILDFLKTD